VGTPHAQHNKEDEMNKRSLVLLTLALLLGILALAAGLTTAAPAVKVAPKPIQPASRASIAWSSGWVDIAPGEVRTFFHGLGGDPSSYIVDLTFRDIDGDLGIHRFGYGGLEVNGLWLGAHWRNLTPNTVQVYRQANDIAADQIRINVWLPAATPDYDSGWVDIAPGQTITLNHNLGITATELGTSLWFSETVRGIHHFAYGGLAVDGTQDMLGAHWHDLTDNTVQVTRHPDDGAVEQIRMLVTHPDPPDYDSLVALGGWQSIAAGETFTFTHNLGWNPNLMLARIECYSTTGGIHQWFAGGNHDWFTGYQGAFPRNIAANSVAVTRMGDDQVCPQVRVTVRLLAFRTYLPIVTRSYSGPVVETELAYDDGILDSTDSYTVGGGFATCFTPPGGSATIQRARLYVQQPSMPVEMHVWDATTHADLLPAPYQGNPWQDGWNDIELSGFGVTVTDDFCVGFLYLTDYQPTLGVDTTAPVDGHSYEIDGDYWELQGYDAMIRVVVTQP
jgi:hypothetical protein